MDVDQGSEPCTNRAIAKDDEIRARTPAVAMTLRPVVPKGEALRRAVAWLAEQEVSSPRLIEEACQRFDLGPADEEFLIAEYRRLHERRER